MAQGWKVIGQEFTNGGVNVSYQTDDGVVHTIFVTNGSFTVPGVRQAIANAVATREGVAMLTSDDSTAASGV